MKTHVNTIFNATITQIQISKNFTKKIIFTKSKRGIFLHTKINEKETYCVVIITFTLSVIVKGILNYFDLFLNYINKCRNNKNLDIKIW